MAFRVLWVGWMLVMMSGCASTRAVSPREEDAAWTEVRSRHFRVLTNVEAQTATRAALELETLRGAVSRLWGGEEDIPGSMDVVLLRDAAELEALVPGASGGFSAMSAEGALLVIAQEDSEAGARTRARALGYELSRRVLKSRPRWLAEGLARYLETVSVERGTREAVLGREDAPSLALVREKGWLDIDALWEQEHALKPSPEEQQWRDASAWLWVHFLAHEQPARFGKWLTLLAQGEGSRATWDATFGDLDALRKGVRRHASRERHVPRASPLPAVAEEVTVRALGAADGHVLRARVLLHAPGRDAREEALAEVQRALGEAPTHVDAATLASRLSEDTPEHLQRAHTLVRDHPEDARAWMLLAELLDPSLEPGAQADARRRAASLVRDDVSTLVRVADSYNATNHLEEGLPTARRALELDPRSPAALTSLASLSFRFEGCSEAKRLQFQVRDLLDGSTTADFREAMEQRLRTFERKCNAHPPRP
ncbi:hypothetical protein MFU01_83990 [Myxococcus fulvus]|uniref:Uncharacterized protein n=2 Tax=Myxococcus fulvus TaxID=33 RepID=A0A511TJ46_MYXFU|nr:hypothetical protein [Myxococcus fulvus]GEN13362.1 hypothetical protein MFU01_83990 [Myxococcus fulvus]